MQLGRQGWCPRCQRDHQSCCLLLAHPLSGGHIASFHSSGTYKRVCVHACVQVYIHMYIHVSELDYKERISPPLTETGVFMPCALSAAQQGAFLLYSACPCSDSMAAGLVAANLVR